MRIVSLVPSSTETLLALGADVVACTRFCEQPGLRHVGGPKNPDIASIVELGPDVVVLDRQENRVEDAADLEAAGFELFVSDVRTVDGALGLVTELADLVGAPRPELALPAVAVAPLTAFVPIWRRPWMSINADTYGGSVLERLGCRLVTADAELNYPIVQLDEIAAAEPDVVLVPSEPYDFAPPHLDELRAALGTSAMELVDGQDLFWWGIRTPAAIERLGAALDHIPARRTAD